MNTIAKTTPRPTLSLPFAKKAHRPADPATTTTLSRLELERIVAAMVG